MSVLRYGKHARLALTAIVTDVRTATTPRCAQGYRVSDGRASEDSHAVRDQTQTDEHVVTLKGSEIVEQPLCRLSYALWAGNLPHIAKRTPRLEGGVLGCDPLLALVNPSDESA